MKIIVTGKNIAISEKIQDAIDKKFEKLGKYFADDIQAKVIIHPEKSNQGNDFQSGRCITGCI